MVNLTSIEAFLYDEARLLDDAKLLEWIDLYDDAGVYWMPTYSEQQCAETEPSILYENKLLMDVRRRNFGHELAPSMEYSVKGCRIIGNVRLADKQSDDGSISIASSFHAHIYYRDEVSLFAGRYTHDLIEVDGGYKILKKRVDLINADGIQRNLLIYI